MDLDLPAPDSLSALGVDDLEAALKPLFESSAPIALQMVGVRFASWDAVLAAASLIMGDLGLEQRLELLRGHARLGENPEALKTISQVSFAEQQVPSGDVRTDADVRRTLLELGQAYEQHFGFPFVEFVAGRPLIEIIPVLEVRLHNPPDVELAAALRAVADIAADRLARTKVSG